MIKKTELIICTEKGYLESLSKALIFTLRTFGGAYKDIPIYSYQPRKDFPVSKATRAFFEQYGVEYVDLNLNTEFSHYPLANKPLACAHREQHTKAEVLIFMDSDIVFQKEPTAFSDLEQADVLLRPVDAKNIGTNGADGNEDYWNALYQLLNVNIKREVRSTVDNHSLLEYYNSGQIIANNNKALFAHWKENFTKTMHAKLMPKQGLFFVEQSVFSATLAQLELNIKSIDKYYNVPIHMLKDFKNEAYTIDSIEELVTMHYHKLFLARESKALMQEQLNQYEVGRTINQYLKAFEVIPKSPWLKVVDDAKRMWRN